MSGENERPKAVLKALRGEASDRPPIWLMRQAGRYLPEYRATRAQAKGFLDLCYTPELAIEVTLQPIRRFGFDAAILFSDILVIPDALGVDVSFVEGEGPKLVPVTDAASIDRLRLDRLHDHLEPVYQVLDGLRVGLPRETTLIGFAGAPWTLAAYMIEGGGSRDYQIARSFARTYPALFRSVINILVDAVSAYLIRQVQRGAEVLQIFDSWAGVLAPDERERWCLEPLTRIVDTVRSHCPTTPIILFPRGVGAAYTDVADRAAPDGISLDTSVDPHWAARNLAPDKVPCLQGNLDPVALLVGGNAMRHAADNIKRAWQDRAYIFNLGHGIVPQVPPEHVGTLIEHLNS